MKSRLSCSLEGGGQGGASAAFASEPLSRKMPLCCPTAARMGPLLASAIASTWRIRASTDMPRVDAAVPANAGATSPPPLGSNPSAVLLTAPRGTKLAANALLGAHTASEVAVLIRTQAMVVAQEAAEIACLPTLLNQPHPDSSTGFLYILISLRARNPGNHARNHTADRHSKGQPDKKVGAGA